MQLYKKISAANRIKYGTEAEKVLEIIINQYSDRTHFIYEILQNAEDAGASQIRFHLTPNALEIYHNGRHTIFESRRDSVPQLELRNGLALPPVC